MARAICMQPQRSAAQRDHAVHETACSALACAWLQLAVLLAVMCSHGWLGGGGFGSLLLALAWRAETRPHARCLAAGGRACVDGRVLLRRGCVWLCRKKSLKPPGAPSRPKPKTPKPKTPAKKASDEEEEEEEEGGDSEGEGEGEGDGEGEERPAKKARRARAGPGPSEEELDPRLVAEAEGTWYAAPTLRRSTVVRTAQAERERKAAADKVRCHAAACRHSHPCMHACIRAGQGSSAAQHSKVWPFSTTAHECRDGCMLHACRNAKHVPQLWHRPCEMKWGGGVLS